MKELLFFVLAIAGLVVLFRYLRQREIDAFLDADMGDFQTFKASTQTESKDPILSRAEAYAALNPNVVSLKPPAVSDGDEPNPASLPDPALYQLKARAFDEIKRHMLILLNAVSTEKFIVLNDVPLAEFVTCDKAGNESKLQNTLVAFLVCDKRNMAVICGVQLKGATSAEFIKGVFGDIGKPCIEFPLTTDVSEDEVRDQLDEILHASEEHLCPKRGDPMTMRKAVKGKNAGAIFWVCSRFPSCRGVIRV